MKIENVPGETPKLYGRHFDETDMLISKVSWGFYRDNFKSASCCFLLPSEPLLRPHGDGYVAWWSLGGQGKDDGSLVVLTVTHLV